MDSISPEIVILLPIMPPKTEKSHFNKAFESTMNKEDLGFDRISLKETKKECAENFARFNKEKQFTWEQLKMHTAKDAERLFKVRLGELIRTAALRKKKAHFIYVERDHLPDMLPSAIKLIREYSENINVKIVALVPDQENYGIWYEARGNTHLNPFSLNFAFAGFGESLKKNCEVMLDGVVFKSTTVFLYFLHKYTNFSLRESSVLYQGFDKVFYVPLVDEQNPSAIPEELVEALVNTLKSCEPGRNNFNPGHLKELCKVYEELKVPFRYVEEDAIENSIMKFLELEIYPDILLKKSQKNDVPETSEPVFEQQRTQPTQRNLTKVELRRQEKEKKHAEKMATNL